MSQYIYKNKRDSIRIVIFSVGNEDSFGDSDNGKQWNLDIWTRNEDEGHRVETYSEYAFDLFATKRSAKKYASDHYGDLTSICPRDTVTDGWGNTLASETNNGK